MEDRQIYEEMYDIWISNHADEMIKKGKETANWLFCDWYDREQTNNESPCNNGFDCSSDQFKAEGKDDKGNRIRDGN